LNQDILIAGGYGVVGRRIAADLATDFPNRVVVAGRDQSRATEAAAKIGHGARGRVLDVTDKESIAKALWGVGAVVSCIDQPGRKLFWAALKRGLRYTDITPHLNALGRGSAYDDVVASARSSGARIVLGTGLVPGISSVMVRALADRLGGADQIETDLLLNANDISGRASFEYFLQELSMSFQVWINGKDYPARSFTEPRIIQFPDPIGARESYLFPFSDQVLFPRTMGVRTAVTRLAIEPVWVARALHILARTGASHIVANHAIRHMISRTRRDRPSAQGASFALQVQVRHDVRSGLATLIGRTQADAAAIGAAEVLRVLLNGDTIKPGAWMPEQVVQPVAFMERLERRGLFVKVASEGVT
jgi:saccharopine dehydrogenase (NAD+, L-lysine forming)